MVTATHSPAATLPDGTEVLIRPLRPSDRAAYAEAMETMSPRSRYLRFATPKPRFTAKELDFLTQVDDDRHVALVAVAGEAERGVGVARYVRVDHPTDRTADVAIGVTDAWQRRGLGSLLLSRLIDRARAAGLTALTATALSENVGSLRMLHGAGFALTTRDGITNDYRLDLASDRVAA